MKRQLIAEATLLEILVDDTANVLGRDANFLGNQIEIRRREGEPNCDANCGIATPIVLKAFATALTRARAKYNLD